MAGLTGATALAIGAATVMVATAGTQGPAFIPGDRPVSEDQIREKLQSDGYANIQIVRHGRYFEATGSKDGAAGKVNVDSQTGRLAAGDGDGDGDDDD